jgi:pyruvate kinase
MKKTKIVCTIGPASETVETLVELMNAGMNVARLNFSHGDFEEHGARIRNIREAAEITGKTIALLLDTKGPEIRTNNMKDGIVELSTGDVVRIAMEEVEGTKEKFSITYPELINDVVVGNHILLDDGLVDLEVIELDKANNEIVTKVLNDGALKNKKGVNVPNVSINLPGITEKDAADIRFGIENDVDFIAASFVRRPSDVLEITKILEEENATHIQIVSKIENQEGIDNLDDILKVSDGLMVARGDLGVEIPTEDVPVVQKEMIKKCNAIYDGTDAIMLSGETAAGDYPVEAVQTMHNIAVRTEGVLVDRDAYALKLYKKADMTESIGQAVGHTAKNLGIQTIVAATDSGHTARMISKYRPKSHIVAVTFSDRAARSLALNWGVFPQVAEKPASTDEMFVLATEVAKETGFAKDGDLILITAGAPIGQKGTTNLMKIQLIGSELANGQGIGNESVTGKAVVASSSEEAVKAMENGSILVVNTTCKDYMPAIEKASALVVEEGGLTSHAAVVAIAQGIPVIVGVENATSVIENDMIITIDPRRGNLFKGESAF